MVRGPTAVVAMLGAAVLLMTLFFLLGEELRQEYHVLSRGDKERFDADLGDGFAAWVEDAEPGGAVLANAVGRRTALTLEPRNASTAHPVVAEGPWVAWVEPASGVRVAHVRFVEGRPEHAFLPPIAGAWLPGRSMAPGVLVVVQNTSEGPRAVQYALPPDVASFGGWNGTPVSAPTDRPVHVAGGRAWWADGASIRGAWLDGRRAEVEVPAGGNVTEFDVDGDLVAWAEDRGRIRRVMWADVGNGTRGEVSGFEGDQHGPAVNGTRVVLVQRDGLVRLKDLATGAERVLPARTQENIHLRLGREHALWLSGTIEGHNVFLVPAT